MSNQTVIKSLFSNDAAKTWLDEQWLNASLCHGTVAMKVYTQALRILAESSADYLAAEAIERTLNFACVISGQANTMLEQYDAQVRLATWATIAHKLTLGS